MKEQEINRYMSLVSSVKEYTKTRVEYHIGGRFVIEVCRITSDLSDKNNMMNVWKKYGYISAVLPSWLSINTFYYDKSGNCWGRYNTMEKDSENGKHRVINFDFLREATLENERELVAECIRLMLEDEGPRYRDESGKLTAPVAQIADETAGEARQYYQDGEFYDYHGKMYALNLDGSDLAHFIGPDDYNLFVPVDRLGTFLPGIASVGEEITII